MKIYNSIKGRLVLWIFTFISVLLIIIGVSIYYKVKNAIFTSIDNSLDSKIEIVTGLLHYEEGEIEFELSEFVSGSYAVPRSGAYYKVLLDGEVFAASPSLADDTYDFVPDRSGMSGEDPVDVAFTAVGPGDERVRVMKHEFDFLGRQAAVYLAESIEESLYVIERIRLFLIFTVPLSILLAGLVSMFIVKRSLTPLSLFSGAVRQITHENLNERIEASVQTNELKDLAASFNGMLDRLQKAFEVEKRIISDASHELKTPLSVIRTQCDIILRRSRTADEYIEAVETIKESGMSMNRLVNDLLSLARLDSGLLIPEKFSDFAFNECIEDAAALVALPAEKRGVRIITDLRSGAAVSGEKEKLTEAILNIIENAVKYNKEGGSVVISASLDDKEAMVRIEDTGMGIAEDERDRIFERFYRADRSRSTEGTGLGLSISKAVIEAHNGRIEVSGSPGKGSCFTVIIPAAK